MALSTSTYGEGRSASPTPAKDGAIAVLKADHKTARDLFAANQPRERTCVPDRVDLEGLFSALTERVALDPGNPLPRKDWRSAH